MSECDIFAQRLKAARGELRGISQYRLSAMTGIQEAALSRYASGERKPSFESLLLIAKALEVTTDYLCGFSDNPTERKDYRVEYELKNLNYYDRKLVHDFIKMLESRNAESECTDK